MENENKKSGIAKKLILSLFAIATICSLSYGALLAYQAISGTAGGNVEQGLETTFADATFGSTADAGLTWDLGTVHGNDAINITLTQTNAANRDASGTFAVVVSSDDTLVCGTEIESFAFYPNGDGLITATDAHATDNAPLVMNCLASGLNEITYTGAAPTAITAGTTFNNEIDFALNPLFAGQTLDFEVRFN